VNARAPFHAALGLQALTFVALSLLGRQQLELARDPLGGGLAGAGAGGPGHLQQLALPSGEGPRVLAPHAGEPEAVEQGGGPGLQLPLLASPHGAGEGGQDAERESRRRTSAERTPRQPGPHPDPAGRQHLVRQPGTDARGESGREQEGEGAEGEAEAGSEGEAAGQDEEEHG